MDMPLGDDVIARLTIIIVGARCSGAKLTSDEGVPIVAAILSTVINIIIRTVREEQPLLF